MDDNQRPASDSFTTGKNLYVDLGAEQLIGAEKDIQKIAVEIKGFIQQSDMDDMDDLEDATGQFVVYERLLKRYDPERTLYLAVTETVRRNVFDEEAGQVLLEDGVLCLFSFEPTEERIITWIP